jgi:hypothetical protein
VFLRDFCGIFAGFLRDFCGIFVMALLDKPAVAHFFNRLLDDGIFAGIVTPLSAPSSARRQLKASQPLPQPGDRRFRYSSASAFP